VLKSYLVHHKKCQLIRRRCTCQGKELGEAALLLVHAVAESLKHFKRKRRLTQADLGHLARLEYALHCAKLGRVS
jgi:predicted alpha-1,6-mannanase (GH76 family)